MNKKVNAMIRSLNAADEATIVSHVNNNNVIAEYQGKKYTAVYNCFTGSYYVDDVDGGVDI